MITCIAVDDEPLALSLLCDNIGRVPYLKLIAACDNAFEAARALHQDEVDLIFIDIEMPGLSGLQFIKTISKKPIVILITAYQQYALDGYNLDVVDYLLKPVALDRFMKACNKAQELYQLKNGLLQNQTSDYIFLNIGYSRQKIVLSDIIWIEGLRDYIQIHLKSAPKPIIVRMSIKAIEEQLLSTDFIRIHRSYIVSKENITAIRKNSIFIYEKELSIGETYKHVIEELLNPNG